MGTELFNADFTGGMNTEVWLPYYFSGSLVSFTKRRCQLFGIQGVTGIINNEQDSGHHCLNSAHGASVPDTILPRYLGQVLS